ncbi:acyltransferase domain-containing protein [Nocardia sp. NPDC004722]
MEHSRASTDPTPFPRVSIVGVGCRATGTDFDHEWFGLDRLAAAGLTPRQRTNLEVAVEALDDSGLGCLAPASNAAVVFGAIGGTNSAHHLSRALDLRGPSLTVDSQRASPLVAVDMGVRLLADESVPFVLAGGVDLTLLPDISDLRIPLPRSGGGAADEDIGPRGGICTVLVLQRTTDALRTGTRRYAEIGAPVLGFPEAESLDAHITLDEPAGPPGYHERGEEPPVLVPITGPDPATVHALALRWAVAVGSYRSLREFASATARLIPEDTRAAILARDPAEAADRLRTLARRIASKPPAAATLTTAVPLPGPNGVFTPARVNQVGDTLFLFPGSGFHPRMGRRLAARYPIFATTLTTAADAVAAAGGPRVWTPRHGFQRAPRTTGPNTGCSMTIVGAQPSTADPDTDHDTSTTPSGGPHLGGSTADSADDKQGAQAQPAERDGAAPISPEAAARYTRGAALPSDRGTATPATAVNGETGGGRVVFEQVALFVFQVALAELLESWGIHADAVAGHGAGEVAAAVACGALSLDDGARVAVARARLLERAGGGGAVAVLEATPAEVARLVDPMRAEVAIATVDGPTTITVAGTPRYIEALIRRAHRRAIFAQRVSDDAVPAAAHLPAIRGRADELRAELTDLAPVPPSRPLYSTTLRSRVLRPPGSPLPADDSTGRSTRVGSTPTQQARLTADYWADNASCGVELAAALEIAAAEGITSVLEVGPYPVLTPGLRERAPFRNGVRATLARDDEAESLLRTIAEWYLEGRSVDWTALGPHLAAPPQRQWRRGDAGDGQRWPPAGYGAAQVVPAFPAVEIRAEGAYVVAGGLGPQGEAAVRWLLEAGARDVVVLTRSPRPLPVGLAGMEDRIVVMRCDCADRTDLAMALQDIRECGAAIRGVVHASGETRLVAAANLLELTAADPTDFTVLLTPVPGAGEPEEVRELAAAQVDRRVICVDWEVGPAA